MKNSVILTLLEIAFVAHGMPIIGDAFPSALYAIIVLVLFLCLLNKIGIARLKPYLPIFIMPFLILIVTNLKLDNPIETMRDLSGFLQICIYPMIAIDIVSYDKKNNAILLLGLYLLIFFITAVTTHLCLQIYPGAVRAVVGSADLAKNINFAKMNLGSFDFVYQILYVEITLVYLIKNRDMYKHSKVMGVICIALLVLLLILTIECEFTTSILFYVLISFSLFLPKKFNTKQFIGIIIIGTIAFVVLRGSAANIIEHASRNIESTDVSMRLSGLAASLKGEYSGDNVDLEGRVNRMKTAISYFSSNPLGGWGLDENMQLGEHSYFVDSMAYFGVFAILFFILMIRSLFKRINTYYGLEKVYLTIALFIFIFTAIANPHLYIEQILFYLPLFFYYVGYVNNREVCYNN